MLGNAKWIDGQMPLNDLTQQVGDALGDLGWDLVFDAHTTRVQVLLLIQRQFLHSTH